MDIRQTNIQTYRHVNTMTDPAQRAESVNIWIFNSPGVAGAVLQTPSSFIQWFIKWCFVQIFSKDCLSQTVRAGELIFWENVHPTPYVTCHVSHVMCHMSHVTCNLYIFSYLPEQSCGVFCLRVWYQLGLPRLVFKIITSVWYCNLKNSCEKQTGSLIPTIPGEIFFKTGLPLYQWENK